MNTNHLEKLEYYKILEKLSNFCTTKYGKNLVLKLISQKNYDKYISRIEKGNKFDKFFALAMLAPCAPDDLLCFLAGMTPMTLKKFVCIIFICKPWSIVAYSMTMNIALTWICSLF